MTFSTPKPPMTLPELSNWVCGAKAGVCAGIGIGKAVARQLVAGGAHISCVGGEVAELALQAERPGVESGVAEGAVDAAEVERADRAALGEGGHVLLIAVHIHDGVGGDGLGVVRRRRYSSPAGV